MKQSGIGERAAWGDFPAVVANGDLGSLKKEPEYQAAKSGDKLAALEMVDRLMTDETVEKIKGVIGDKPVSMLPVMAEESSGRNMIPLAIAEVLASRLDTKVELGIYQSDRISRTDAGSDHRLAYTPTFDGEVEPGKRYLIVDDTLTMGGTIASLRGYVENRGGDVVAASVMTAHPGALTLPVQPKMLAGIESKHGSGMNDFWNEDFGYGIDKLTQAEAGHLKAAKSIDAMRTRIAEARNAGSERLDASRAETTQSESRAGETKTEGDGQVIQNAGGKELSKAEQLEAEQQSLIENASIEQTYDATLASFVDAKHAQVDRIGQKLERLISSQESKLQKTLNNQPGFFSMPGSRSEWGAQKSRQQSRIQTLHNRLDSVQEIRDGMGLHAPRVEEMATKKMRAQEPELASSWDSMRETARRHHLSMQKKKEEQERARRQEQGQEQKQGVGIKLGRSGPEL